MNQIGNTAFIPHTPPASEIESTPAAGPRAASVEGRSARAHLHNLRNLHNLRKASLAGSLSLLLALGACGIDPGQHYTSGSQDRYGTSVTGVPGAQSANGTAGASQTNDDP